LIFQPSDFSRASTEKNTKQFQALNGLKRSTVGNLGSYWHSL